MRPPKRKDRSKKALRVAYWAMVRGTVKPPLLVGVAALCSFALACTGIIETGDGRPGSGTDDGNPATGGGSGLTKDPGRKEMHRLNSAEYNATVTDVLGTALQPADSSWRGGEIDGWDNIATVLGVDNAQYERYYGAAEQLAEDVFASPARKSRFVTCTTADDAACVQGVIASAGLRIFRRPLTTEEVATYQKVYAAGRSVGDDHDASLELVLQSLLSSAEFLYRIEFDPDPTSLEPHPVDPYELASRLSYFLWSSAPDDVLLAAAADKSISKDATLSAAVDRMLLDGKAQRLIDNFAGQWLGGRKVATHAVDAGVYPDWTPDLAAAAAQELYQYFGEFLLKDRPWTEFLTADFNFVQGPLAEFYGVTPPAAGMERMEITTDQRFGFLGLSGFLAMSSITTRTSPTLRGKWLLVNMLCVRPEPPPGKVPELEDGTPNLEDLSIREKLEQHRENPACAGCHAIIDPYGLALEEYDGIGRYRTAYPDGTPIDPSTTLADGVTLSGLSGVANNIGQNAAFSSCVAEKLLTYGLGRLAADTDKPYLAELSSQWTGETPTLRKIIRSLVLTDPFRLRRGEVAQ